MEAISARLEGALTLIAAGASIIPCGADKRPFIPWRANHSRNEAIVRAWWKRWPHAIPAVITGAPSGVWIVDLDIDKTTGEPIGEAAAAELGIFPEEHPYAIRSPSGGWHLPYRYRPGLPGNTAKRLRCIDTRGDGGYIIAWDPDRLAAAIADPSLPSPPEQLVAALTRPPPIEPPPDREGEFHDRYVRAALDRECRAVATAAQGTRNDTLNRAAFAIGQLVGAGALHCREAEAHLLAAALACGLDVAEARATIASGLRAGQAQPRAAPPPRPCAVGRAASPAYGALAHAPQPDAHAAAALPLVAPLVDDLAALPRRQWIGGHGAFPRGRLTAVAGPPGVSKTTAALSIACALALGLSYGPVEAGPRRRVLIACIEDDIDELRRRIHAWMDRFAPSAADRETLMAHLALIDLADHVPLVEVDIDGTARLTEGAFRLEAAIAEYKPDVLILDPLIELHTADENKNHLVRPVLRHLRHWAAAYNAAVVILHHETKAGEGTALQRLRGAGAIGGAIRHLLSLRHMTAEEAAKYSVPEDWADLYIRVETGKQQYARRSKDRWLVIEEHELPNGDVAPVLVPWEPPRQDITPDMLIAAEQAVRDGYHGVPLTTSNFSPACFQHAFERAGIPRGLARAVLDRLIREERVWHARWFDPEARKARKRLRATNTPLEGWLDDDAPKESRDAP